MGRATINHHIGNGLYSVNLQVDVDRLRMRKEQLQDLIPQYELRIPDAQAKAQQAYAARIARETELNTTILTNLDDILKSKASRELEAAIDAHVKAEGYLGGLRMELAAMQLELEQIGDPQPEYAAEVWCADYTEDLTGTVGTVEADMANGPGSADVQIRPGYNGGAAYNAPRDGLLQDVDAATPASFFYNLCMLPGVRKWMPRYSYGVISSKSGEPPDVIVKVKVTTGPYKSEEEKEAPVVYMTCDEAVFEKGDHVLLEWKEDLPEGEVRAPGEKPLFKPVVVGFRDNPFPCFATCIETSNMQTRLPDTEWNTHFNAWYDQMAKWREYVMEWEGYMRRWNDFLAGMPSEMMWMFTDAYDEAAKRFNSMKPTNKQLEENWWDINSFNSYYWWIYLNGQIGITPKVGGDDEWSALQGLNLCVMTGVSEAETPDYASLRAREYLGGYGLDEGDPKMFFDFKTWWNPKKKTCNIAIKDIIVDVLAASLIGMGDLTHEFYIDGEKIGGMGTEEDGSAIFIPTVLSFEPRKEYHVRVDAKFNTWKVPEGTVPAVSDQNWNVPVRLTTDVPKAASLDYEGMVDLAFTACTFDFYVVKFPEDPKE